MSELKAETIVPQGSTVTLQMYPKAEADKVIAGLKSEIERLEILCANYRHDCDNLAISNEQAKRAARTLLKKMNHNKYKRCLDKARIAQDDWHLHNSFYAMGHQEFEKRKCSFYEKWHKRWLELAEKFKEAK